MAPPKIKKPISSTPPPFEGAGDVDVAKLINKGPGGGSLTTPGGGRGVPDIPISNKKPAPSDSPTLKDKPDPKTKASTVAGGAGAAAGGAGLLAGLGLGGMAGVAQAGAAGYAAKQAADATKTVGDTITKTVESITTFLSDPAVLGTAVGLTALVVIGPIILASITAGASTSKSSSGQTVKA